MRRARYTWRSLGRWLLLLSLLTLDHQVPQLSPTCQGNELTASPPFGKDHMYCSKMGMMNIAEV